MILYLHGFNSSSASSKAQVMLGHCERENMKCLAPDLPHRPSEALLLMEDVCQAHDNVTAVGSSLGGYYATWLVERGMAGRGVLINPAVAVAEKLRQEVGKEQTNYHDASTYTFTPGHVKDLEDMAVEKIADPKKYLLLVQEGDEVLDHREAVAFYGGCEQVVEQGGDHSFDGFERHLEKIVAFAGGA